LAVAPLARWDRYHARGATKVLADSEAVRRRIQEHWGAEAEVLYPPHGVEINAPQRPVPGILPGYLLTVARLLAYKRVDVVVRALREQPQLRLIVVGTGPKLSELKAIGARNVTFLGRVGDAELRWLYANAAALVSAASEDLGLAPLEAMAFGRPVAVVRAGGFKETVLEGVTGTFFERPEPEAARAAITRVLTHPWDHEDIAAHAARFDEQSFGVRLRSIAAALLADAL
jgi:glycosyltransferase involved in cell wall biosynthesis